MENKRVKAERQKTMRPCGGGTARRDGFRQSARGHSFISPFIRPEDGHASSETDGEASVNECDNNRAVSPCSSGSGVTHLSLTLHDGVCVVPRV